MLVFNFIFDILWTDRDFSVRSAVFLGFCELKYIEKQGSRAWVSSPFMAKGHNC